MVAGVFGVGLFACRKPRQPFFIFFHNMVAKCRGFYRLASTRVLIY